MILNDILRTRDVYLITGYTDLRKSIDGLAIKALESFDLNPLEMKEAAFMYCVFLSSENCTSMPIEL